MLLQTQHLSKAFGGVYALRDIDFSIRGGEIHGLVGENGAGKSTLIKLLTGVYQMQEGAVLWEDTPVSLDSPQAARALGIHVIHQDRTLISTFDCVENAYLGLEYPTRLGRVDWGAMRRRVQETADRLGIALDLRKTAAELSPPQRTELEIVRAMMHQCRLLILDEPTAALSDQESQRLFALIRSLKQQGTSILYVTHRLEEIFLLTDRITILRNGMLVDTLPTNAITQESLIAKMTDNAPIHAISHKADFGKVLLEARDIASMDGTVENARITVHSGEILGLFGLGGSGRTELLESIFGCRRLARGKVELNGSPLLPSPEASLKQGMVLISEDRRGKAMAGNLSVRENMMLSSIDGFSRLGLVRAREESEAVSRKIDALQIKLRSPGQRMAELSGGNQQKVVFARVLLTHPKVFLCDEPTQAVDVATRNEIHRLLRQKADEGAAVVYVSSDLKELLEVADTIQVISRGRTQPPRKNENLYPQQVLSCCYTSCERRMQP